jgi:hypothetical protein
MFHMVNEFKRLLKTKMWEWDSEVLDILYRSPRTVVYDLLERPLPQSGPVEQVEQRTERKRKEKKPKREERPRPNRGFWVHSLCDEERAVLRERLRQRNRELKEQRLGAFMSSLRIDDTAVPQGGDLFGVADQVQRGIERGVASSFAKLQEQMLKGQTMEQVVEKLSKSAVDASKYKLLQTAGAASNEAFAHLGPKVDELLKNRFDATIDSFIAKVKAALGENPVVQFVQNAIDHATRLCGVIAGAQRWMVGIFATFVLVVTVYLLSKYLPPFFRGVLPAITQAGGFPVPGGDKAYTVDWAINALLNGIMVTFGIAQGSKAANTILSIASRSVPLTLYARGVLEGAIEWAQYCINVVRKYFGYDEIRFYEKRATPVLTWLSESYRICADDKPPETKEERGHVVEHYKAGLRLRSTAIGRECAQEIERALAHMKAYKIDSEASLALEKANREEPIVVVLSGKPGIGKTTLVRQLVGPICAGIRPDIAANMRKDPSYNPDRHFYPKPSGDFHEGYDPQQHVVYGMDDIGTVRPGSGNTSVETDCMLFMRLVNIGVTPLNMAALESKGTTFFNSPVILATTNMERERLLQLANKEITNPEALDRRLHLWLEMELKPEYAIPDPEVKKQEGNEEVRRMAEHVLGSSAANVVLGPEAAERLQRPSGGIGKLDMVKFQALSQVEREQVYRFSGTFCGKRISFETVGELIKFIIDEVRGRQAVNSKLNKDAVNYALSYADVPQAGSEIEYESALFDDSDDETEYCDEDALLLRAKERIDATTLGAHTEPMTMAEYLAVLGKEEMLLSLTVLSTKQLRALFPTDNSVLDVSWRDRDAYAFDCALRFRLRLLDKVERWELVRISKFAPALAMFQGSGFVRRMAVIPIQIRSKWEELANVSVDFTKARAAFGKFMNEVNDAAFHPDQKPGKPWYNFANNVGAFCLQFCMGFFGTWLVLSVIRGIHRFIKYMFTGRDLAEPQGGDPGELVAKANENSWHFKIVLRNGDVIRCGSVLFVQENICLMPAHYIENLSLARSRRGEVSHVLLSHCNSAATVRVDQDLVTRSSRNIIIMKDKVGRDQDMALFLVPNMRPNATIVHRFRSETAHRSYRLHLLTRKDNDAKVVDVQESIYATHKQYECPISGAKYLCTQYVSYKAETGMGDCGSVLFSFKDTVPTLYGLHTAGSPHISVGYSMMITREELEDHIGKLQKHKGITAAEAAVDTGPYADAKTDMQAMGVCGVSKVGRDGADRTGPSMWPSAVCGWHKPLTEYSVVKKPVDCSNRATLTELASYMEPNKISLTEEEKQCVRLVARQMLRDHGIDKLDPSLITSPVAVQGRDGLTSVMEPVPRNTSAGFPYRNLGHEKSKFVDIDGQINFDSPTWELVCRDVDTVLARARIGVTSVTDALVFQVSPKAELRSPDKGPRIIQGAPVVLTIAFRRLFWDLLRFYGTWSPEKEVGIGLDPHSHWGQLVQWLTDHGTRSNFIAGDYKQFDKNQEHDIKECLFDAIIDCYPAFDSYNTARRILLNTADGAMVIFAGKLYRVPKGMPSGHPGTSLINGLYNCLLYRLAFARSIFPTQGRLPMRDMLLSAAVAFREHVRLSVTGDDNIATSTYETFNEQVLPTHMAQFGAIYTMDVKTAQATKAFRGLEEVSYLGRAFRRDPGRANMWVAPLRMESILLMGQYAEKRSQITTEWYRATLASLLGELSNHPDEVWTRVAPIVWEAFRDHLGGRVVAPEERTLGVSGVYPLRDDLYEDVAFLDFLGEWS